MAYKRPPFPMHEGTSPHKSALKDIVRGIGPHNPAHRAIGDESDAAHDTPEFQKAGDAYQAEQQKKAEEAAKAAYEKAKKDGTIVSNPRWRSLAFKAGYTNALVKKDGEFVPNPFSKAK